MSKHWRLIPWRPPRCMRARRAPGCLSGDEAHAPGSFEQERCYFVEVVAPHCPLVTPVREFELVLDAGLFKRLGQFPIARTRERVVLADRHPEQLELLV